jgi:hypothetical protein
VLKALCLFKDQFAHIKPVELTLNSKVEFVYDEVWDEKIIDEINPDIVIGINEFHIEIARCYQKAQKKNIPTLTIQDGILEWRFMFQNELYSGNEFGVPMHHPILADKYACLGFSLASIIASLGNAHRVEIIGMPKLDTLTPIALQPGKTQKKKVLIITAAKPWFDDAQKIVVLNMLYDLKEYFNQQPTYEVTWRITKLLDKELSVQTSFESKSTTEIVDQIREADLIISTTSTAIIEAMRCGKPVAKIDYFNLPDMLQTVWNIKHKNDIELVLQQMSNPSPQHCWYQNFLLNTHCINDANAAERMAELILAMIDFRKKSNTIFPSNMSSVKQDSLSFFYPLNFYADREVIQNQDLHWLQTKLIRLELRNSLLQKQLQKRGLGYFILKSYSKILQHVRK